MPVQYNDIRGPGETGARTG